MAGRRADSTQLPGGFFAAARQLLGDLWSPPPDGAQYERPTAAVCLRWRFDGGREGCPRAPQDTAGQSELTGREV